MMAKMNEELKEIRAKSTEQIHDEVVDELRMLKLQRSAWNDFKSSEFHRMRKRLSELENKLNDETKFKNKAEKVSVISSLVYALSFCLEFL
ncbi:hypothetical protein QQ045_004571 [Rhodiola kirilowii]